MYFVIHTDDGGVFQPDQHIPDIIVDWSCRYPCIVRLPASRHALSMYSEVWLLCVFLWTPCQRLVRRALARLRRLEALSLSVSVAGFCLVVGTPKRFRVEEWVSTLEAPG